MVFNKLLSLKNQESRLWELFFDNCLGETDMQFSIFLMITEAVGLKMTLSY